MASRRHRVELDPISYEALRYFGLLRGRPIGQVMTRILADHADKVQKEFPAVRAHVLAWGQAQQYNVHVIDGVVEDVVPF